MSKQAVRPKAKPEERKKAPAAAAAKEEEGVAAAEAKDEPDVVAESKPPKVSKKKTATAAPPAAAAAATKKAKTAEHDNDNEEESDDADEDAAAQAAKADHISEAELAERRRKLLGVLFRQRTELAVTYTSNKCKVRKVLASAFAKNGIQASTLCTVCETAIMGACKACFLIQDGETTVHAVHDKCFRCSHYKDEEHVCGQAPFVVDLDATGNNNDEEEAAGRQLECYVDRSDGPGKPPQPVCMDHIDLHSLDLPKYDADDTKNMLEFFNRRGFVIVKSGAVPGFWEEKAIWINKVLAMMVGWTEEQRLHYMSAQGWDFHFRDLPGFKQHCLGVTGTVKGDSKKYAADVVQSKEAWDARAAVFPLALPFFSGNKPTVMAGMAPVFVLAHYTALQTQALQFFPSETRQTNEREDSSKPGRAKAIEIINGMVMAAPCNDISVIVCPLAWESRAGPTTFDREWKIIEQRQEAGGGYHEGHWAEHVPTPLHLDTGDVLLIKGARPFRIASGTANCTGFFLNWQTGVPKTVTMTVRADAVTEGVVIKKNSNMGYRYVNNKGSTNANIPRDFGSLVTPITVNTVGQYAAMIFGTNYEDQSQWPYKYRLYAASGHSQKGGMIRGREEAGAGDDDNDLDIRVITEAEAKAKGKPKAPAAAKAKKPAAAAPPAKKPAPEKKKPTPAKKAAAPVAAGASAAAEDDDALEPMDVDGDDADVAEPDENAAAAEPADGEQDDNEEEQQPDTPAPVKKATAKKQKPSAKSTPASVYGEPYVDAKDALEACTRGELPVALHFAPDWLPEDENRLPSYWSTLWSLRERKVIPEDNDVFYAGDVFPRGSVVIFKNDAPRVELFDAFTDLALGGIEEDLRGQVNNLLAQERRIIKVGGEERRLARAVESFGADVRVGNDVFKKMSETPACMTTLLEHLQERNLIATIPEDDGGNPGIVHRISMIAIETRAEGINPFSLKIKELADDSPCYIICLGGMGRSIKFRSLPPKAEAKKNKHKGGVLGSFKAYSGLGIRLPADFFKHAAIEVMGMAGTNSKGEDGTLLPTIPMAVLIVSTVLCSVPKAASKKKAAAANKAAVTAANDAHKLECLRADIVRLCSEFKTRIEGDKFLVARKTEMLKVLNLATLKGGHRVVEDLHSSVADFSQKLTGQDYLLTLSSRPASEDGGDDNDGDNDAVPAARPPAVAKKAPPAPVLKSAAKAAAPAARGKKGMEKVTLPKTAGGDNDDNDLFKVPAVTRKLVVTESGQVARRSARDSKPVADSKLSVAQDQQATHMFILRLCDLLTKKMTRKR